ncbi:MAG: MarR family winged helix-turn-helix transcriptional regulator [Microthrixaceae bacterium]
MSPDAPRRVTADPAPGAALSVGDAVVPGTEALRARLIEVMQAQRQHLEACAERHGLSGQLAIALLQLRSPWPAGVADREDGLPMRELACRLHCDPSQLTGIADRLEAMALVERRPDPADRRVKLLGLTPRGERLAHRLSVELNADAPGFSALTDHERTTLEHLLSKLATGSPR